MTLQSQIMNETKYFRKFPILKVWTKKCVILMRIRLEENIIKIATPLITIIEKF